jgi:tetratricopeptide (TPR) repeat protein
MAKSSNKNTQPASKTSNCFIITGINDEATCTHVESALAQFQNKFVNHEVILSGSAAVSYDQLAGQMKDASFKWVSLVPQQHTHLLGSLENSLKNQKSAKGYVLIPDFATGKTKRSIPQRLGQFFSKVFGLVEINGQESGIAVFNHSDVLDRNLFSALTPFDNSSYKMANWGVLNGLKQKSISFNHVKAKDLRYSYFKSILGSISSRIDWFVKSGFSAFNKEGLANANSGLYRLIFAALCLFSFIVLPILSFDYGATWDEPEDRKYFKEVIAYFQTGGEDSRALDENRKLHDHLVNYGPFVNLTCAFVEEYISPFDTYVTRHIVLSMFAFVGLLFTGLLARKAGSWRTAVIVLLILLFTPAFWGHAANNQKDMPFMAFYIASLFYIVRLIQDLPKPRVKTIVMTGITVGILFSIRAGGLIAFGLLLLFASIKFLLTLKDKDMSFGKRFIRYALITLIPLALAYFIGVIFWPAALEDPFNHPLEALRNFEKFSLVHIYEVFEGERYYMKDYPWYYALKMMWLTLPLLVLAGLGIFAGLVFLKRKELKLPVVLMTAFALVFPIAYIIYKDSALYNSWRHVLFVLPSILILSGLGWDLLLSFKNNVIRYAVIGVMAVAMFLPGSWMIKNHPYEYMYYNEIAGGVKGAFGKYELDYWCQTPRAALKWILANEKFDKKPVQIISNNEIIGMQYYADQYQENGKELRSLIQRGDEITDLVDQLNYYKQENIITEQELNDELALIREEQRPLADRINELRQIRILWSREQQWNKDDWDYAIWTNRTLSPTQHTNGYFPPKGTIHTIEVDGVPVTAVVIRENKGIYEANKLMKEGKYAEAEKHLQDYIKYDSLEEEAYRTLAYIRLLQQRWDVCIALCEKSIELCPESYFSYNFKGVAHLRSAVYNTDKAAAEAALSKAEESFQKAIKFKPNFSSGYDGLGDIAYTRGNTQKALKLYKEALEYMGANHQVYYKMGETYRTMGDLNNAGRYYNAAIQTNQRFAPSYYGMYQILQQAGQNDEAMKYLQQYQQLTGR